MHRRTALSINNPKCFLAATQGSLRRTHKALEVVDGEGRYAGPGSRPRTQFSAPPRPSAPPRETRCATEREFLARGTQRLAVRVPRRREISRSPADAGDATQFRRRIAAGGLGT